MREARAHDLMRGVTSVGPHRDDLSCQLDGEPVAHYASQGQTRALILAFKIAELREARALRGVAPLLLLDDVSSELDPARNARLFTTLEREVGQCVLTTTAADFIHLAPGIPRRDISLRMGEILADSES